MLGLIHNPLITSLPQPDCSSSEEDGRGELCRFAGDERCKQVAGDSKIWSEMKTLQANKIKLDSFDSEIFL